MDYYIAHHGVKGMKWGVRRYQRKGGSYTRKGLANLEKSQEKYAEASAKYRVAKKSKTGVGVARDDKKEARRQLRKDRKQLRQDYVADQGKAIYKSGRRITSNETLDGFLALAGSAAAAAGVKFVQRDAKVGQLSTASIVAGSAAVAAFAGIGASRAVLANQNRKLRAYYGHSRS